MTTRPYVSVVIIGRNDDYGQDFKTRINTFVRSLDHQVRAHMDLWELIVVEWNPMPDRDGLSSVLMPTQNLPVRIITVPADLHAAIGSATPVLEFHAKNAGIRRARGDFVLVTNPDILFTQALIDELAQKRLRTDTVYRTDRYDFETKGIQDVAAAELIDFALDHSFVVHAMQGEASVSIPVAADQRLWTRLPRSQLGPDVWHTNGCGDFMLAARETFFTVRGLYETLEHRWHVDSISLLRFAVAKMKHHAFTSPLCVFHQHHDRRDQDVTFQSLDVVALARKPGDTDWGFRDLALPEQIQRATV
jgi:hypothetical protein